MTTEILESRKSSRTKSRETCDALLLHYVLAVIFPRFRQPEKYNALQRSELFQYSFLQSYKRQISNLNSRQTTNRTNPQFMKAFLSGMFILKVTKPSMLLFNQSQLNTSINIVVGIYQSLVTPYLVTIRTTIAEERQQGVNI